MLDVENDYSFFSKKSGRRLSPFIAQSLYYDYLRQKLDSSRLQALEKFIEENPEAKSDLDQIRGALDFFDRLSQIHVAEEVINDIAQERVGFQRRLGRAGWYQWPTSVRWFIEASVLAVLILSACLLLPWDNLLKALSKGSNFVVLSEVATRFVQPEESNMDGPESLITGRLNSAGVNEAARSVTDQEAASGATAKASLRKLAGLSPQKGMVNRLFVKTAAIDEATEQIKGRLKLLEVTKQGEAELGWRRPGGSYFHFRISEENYEPLLASLRSLGFLQLRQEPSEEAMPEGFRRVVLWVEEIETE